MKSLEKIYIRDGRAPIPRKESTSRVMSANKDKDTKPEILLRKELWSKGFRGYRLHSKKLPGRPDISYSRQKLAIFVNGCFWHRCPICKPKLPNTNKEFWKEKFNKNKKRDKGKVKILHEQGWHVITLWECEIKTDILKCVKEVSKELKNEK